jgi:hypothetical protein
LLFPWQSSMFIYSAISSAIGISLLKYCKTLPHAEFSSLAAAINYHSSTSKNACWKFLPSRMALGHASSLLCHYYDITEWYGHRS